MALIDDPYAPLALDDAVEPWSWVTPEVEQYLAAQPQPTLSPAIPNAPVPPSAPSSPPPEATPPAPPAPSPPAAAPTTETDELAGAREMFDRDESAGFAEGLKALSPFASPFVPDIDEKLKSLSEPAGDLDLDGDGLDVDELSPEKRRRVEDEQETVRLASDPAALAMAKSDREAAVADRASADAENAAYLDAKKAAASEAILARAKKHALEEERKADAEIARIASEDPRSTGTIVGQAITAALAGFLNPRGPNSVLEMIERNIERTVAQRTAAVRERKASIAGGLESAVEDYKLAEVSRIAGYEKAKAEILADAQKYDPRGATVLRHAELLQAIGQAKGEARERLRQQALKEGIEVGKYELEIEKHQFEKQKFAIQERRRAQAAAASARGKQLSPNVRAFLEGKQPDLNTMTMDDLKTISRLKKEQAETGKAGAETFLKQTEAREAAAGPGGARYAFGDQEGNAYKNKDGSVFEIADPKRREAIDNVNSAAKRVRHMADLVKIIRAKKGGASAWLGTDEYQELKTLAAQTDFETYKAFGLGAPSSGDQQLAAAARGGQEITSFIKDPSAGFESYAKGLEEKLNSQMTDYGYTGAPVKLKSAKVPKGGELPVKKKLDRFYSPLLTPGKGADQDVVTDALAAVKDISGDPAATIPMLQKLVKDIRAREADGTFSKAQANKAVQTLHSTFQQITAGTPLEGKEDALLGLGKGEGAYRDFFGGE